ncbi:hypothetical protein WA026_006198 [Henosepilachna vigintioctopunctata]|uniref:Uncharacterized protein n=1 Tax=Henosepilachna vigintioctopunctata TaxID=420089 RepID=A0AAW1TN68_9CUCU
MKLISIRVTFSTGHLTSPNTSTKAPSTAKKSHLLCNVVLCHALEFFEEEKRRMRPGAGPKELLVLALARLLQTQPVVFTRYCPGDISWGGGSFYGVHSMTYEFS